MGDFEKKMSCRLISRGRKHANKFLGKKFPTLKKTSLLTYNAEKNFYLQRGLGKNYQTKLVKSRKPQSPTNVQWSCQPFTG